MYEPLIRQYASKWGIDPDIALRVANAEGGVKSWIQSQYKKNGIQEPSYGPFQMLVGGKGTGYPEGLGNRFISETGLDPRNPANAEPYMDFAMREVANKGWGQWYGAAKAGVSKWGGVGGAPNTASLAPTEGGIPYIAQQQAAASNAAVAGNISSALPTVGATTSVANPSTAAAAADPMGGVFGLLLQTRMNQAPTAPTHTDVTMPRPKMVDNRSDEEKLASVSQTPDVYLERIRRYGRSVA